MPSCDASARGDRAEKAALEYLISEGLCLLQRNYRCRSGEIDLIMVDGIELVVVEVRQRSQARFGSAAESIGRAKQQRILRATRSYLAQHQDKQPPPVRFDVIEVNGLNPTPSNMHWIRDAFTADV